MNVLYHVELSQAERGELTTMLSKGKRAARKLKRAQILLAAAPAAATRRLPAPWRWAAPPCTGPSVASWKEIWNGRVDDLPVLTPATVGVPPAPP
jgi:hypothetical protein